MDTLIEALIQSPLLPTQVERLNRVLVEERTRRQRFYEEMTEDGKWEFINGDTVVQPPAELREIEASGNLFVLVKAHVEHHELGLVTHEKLLVSLTRNDYEPDICFFREEVAASFTSEQMHFPAPDFIAEVLSPSTARADRGVKFRDYAAHGVGEYWLIDPALQTVEQFVRQGEDYQRIGLWAGDAEVVSVAVQGFRIPARAIFERKANLAALTKLLAARVGGG